MNKTKENIREGLRLARQKFDVRVRNIERIKSVYNQARKNKNREMEDNVRLA